MAEPSCFTKEKFASGRNHGSSAHPSRQFVNVPETIADLLPPPADTAEAPAPAKKLICAQCGIKIGYPEGKFCWNNAKRFGGLQYCREHQAAF